MAKKQIGSFVIDTCVILAALMGDSDNDPNPKAATSLSELAAIEDANLKMLLPVMVPPEIAGTKVSAGQPNRPAAAQERWAKAAEFFANSSSLVYLEADEQIAMNAASLASEHQLAAGDAIILASALAYKADTLLTWDKGLLKLSDVLADRLEIRKPQAWNMQDNFQV